MTGARMLTLFMRIVQHLQPLPPHQVRSFAQRPDIHQAGVVQTRLLIVSSILVVIPALRLLGRRSPPPPRAVSHTLVLDEPYLDPIPERRGIAPERGNRR